MTQQQQSRKYTPRRASKLRWLQDAPSYVLDCFDDKGAGDRYTVFFTEHLLEGDGTYAGTYISYLGMSGAPSHPQGVSMWGGISAYQAMQYRYHNGHRRVKWLDLPEEIRRHVIGRAAMTEVADEEVSA